MDVAQPLGDRPQDPVNLHLLKGLRGGYYSYAGSLSTPPCSEGVQRFVVRTINEVSTWQVGPSFAPCGGG